jgi:hypothetical protein
MLHDEYRSIFIEGDATAVVKLPIDAVLDDDDDEIVEIDKKKNRKRRITVTTGYFSKLKNISV